jgi:BASS family bile acid:Na+ symporter
MRLVTRLFPLWAVLFAIAAFLAPQVFKPIGLYVTLLLGTIMFAMDVTLTPAFTTPSTSPAATGVASY